MPFDWMHAELPEDVPTKAAAARPRVQAEDVRARAGLLRRLGHPEDYALHRCLGNLAWAFELRGDASLSDAEVRVIVAEVYAR